MNINKWISCFGLMLLFLVGCGTASTISRTPQQDKTVFEAVNKLAKNPSDPTLQKDFESVYADAVLNHQRKITEYRNSNSIDRWERIMLEYGFLNRLAETVVNNSSASKLVRAQRYDEQYAENKQNAAEAYYERANGLLNENDRDAAQDAYTLLQKLDKLSPNYKDTRRLLDQAYNRSILKVVVVPVNYYAQNYGYWGLQNDYVQQQLVRDLKFQLGSGNVKVFTEQEARAQRINPDRLIELRWDELFMPQPYTRTFTRNVSRQIETGKTKDNEAIYTTVTATLYITQREVRAGGNLVCRVLNGNGQTLLSEYFPSNYNYVQEFATYRGDSRALSNYDWALINNARMNNVVRRDIFTGVLQQVYPQLVSRIRSLNW